MLAGRLVGAHDNDDVYPSSLPHTCPVLSCPALPCTHHTTPHLISLTHKHTNTHTQREKEGGGGATLIPAGYTHTRLMGMMED